MNEDHNFEKCKYNNIHTNYNYNLANKTNPESHAKVPITLDDYNVYAVEIHSDCIRFFVNGQQTFYYPKIEADMAQGQFPCGEERFYLMIDRQVGGGWVGVRNPSQYP